ncbi:Hypothetical predicted protein [Paramuricea clavata]|nr:Hypothetical predicted protein [Paramuricea clavata]
MQSGEILDSAVTASSFYDGFFKPANARLNIFRGKCAWTPTNNGQQNAWIQVDLGDIKLITGVSTQGRCNAALPQWVKSYTVSHSSYGQQWKLYEESGSVKNFTGNTDKTTVVTHGFKNPISARYVKVLPQSFRYRPSMRMELYTGCPMDY